MFRRKHKDDHPDDLLAPGDAPGSPTLGDDHGGAGLLGAFSEHGADAPPAWDAPDHVSTPAEVAQARKAEKQRAREEKARKRKAPKMPCPSCGKPNPIATEQGTRCILCKGLMPTMSAPSGHWDQVRGPAPTEPHPPAADHGDAEAEGQAGPTVDPWAGTHLAGSTQPGDDGPAGPPPPGEHTGDTWPDATDPTAGTFGPSLPGDGPDIEIPMAPPSAQPPPIPPPPLVPEAEHFDPNALIIDDPALPRPTAND